MLPALSRVLAGAGTGHGPCRGDTRCTKMQCPGLRRWAPPSGVCRGMTSWTGTPLGTPGLTPGCMSLPPEQVSSPPAVLPSKLPLSPVRTLTSGRRLQRPATRRRDAWQPGKDPCHSPHPPAAPHPVSPPPPLGSPWHRPHLLLPAALHPGSVIQHGGSCRGRVGCGLSRPPPNPGLPAAVPAWGSEPPSPSRRWAAPSLAPPEDAPLSLLYLIRRQLPALQHLLRGGSRSSFPSPPAASGPQAEGQGEGPGALAGSAISPHILRAGAGDAGRALPTRFLSPVNIFTGMPGEFQGGEGR